MDVGVKCFLSSSGLQRAVRLVLVLAWWIFAACSQQEGPQQTTAAALTGPLQMAYTEIQGDKTTLWLAEAQDLTKRKAIATVQHAEGFGIRARLSPDGQWLAYTALPPTGGVPSADASLWVMKTDGSGQRLLLDKVDLRGTPLWSPDGGKIVAKRASGPGGIGGTEVLMVELASGKKGSLLTDVASAGLSLIGWGQDGVTLFYARYRPEGVDVMAVNVATGAERPLARPAEGPARDFQLSPDGAWILHTTIRKEAGQTHYQLLSLGIDGSGPEVLAQGTVAYYGAVWRPDSRGITYSSGPTVLSDRKDADNRGIMTRNLGLNDAALVVPPPEKGFDVPLAWSPDGRYLAVRFFDGSSDHLVERLALVSPADGDRRVLETKGFVEFIGWLYGAP